MRLEDIEKSQYWLDDTNKKSKMIFGEEEEDFWYWLANKKETYYSDKKILRLAVCEFERRVQ